MVPGMTAPGMPAGRGRLNRAEMITVRRFLASSLLVFLSLTMVHAQDALSSAAPASTPPNSDHSDAKASATGAMSIAPALYRPRR